jgi:hypothetical protein
MEVSIEGLWHNADHSSCGGNSKTGQVEGEKLTIREIDERTLRVL